MRIEEHLQVREQVAHFTTVEIALATDQVIAHPGLPQGHLEWPRLDIGAEKNRLFAPCDALRKAIILDLLNHRPRLFFVALKALEQYFHAGAFLRPERFGSSAGILFDHSI